MSWWHTGHCVETISTEVVAAVAVDVAEVTDTMGRSGSGGVDVVETEAAMLGDPFDRGLFRRVISRFALLEHLCEDSKRNMVRT